MAPKKAAKKVAKKAAKKVPAKGAGHDGKKAGKDTRRAYEHLGRVQSIALQLPEEQRGPLQTLLSQAEIAMRDEGKPRDAADLLRAAEHFAFGTLAMGSEPDTTLAADLQDILCEEFDHLRERAAEHSEAADAAKPVLSIYKQMTRSGKTALKEKRFRAALEFARGAEALTHVSAGTPKLASAVTRKALAKA